MIYEENGSINRHSWNLRKLRKGRLRSVDWNIEQAIAARKKTKLQTFYCSGGSVMLRRTSFLRLGGFHPIFKPFYGEDYDLGLRAWRQGWPSYFEPRVSVIHQSCGSIKSNVKREFIKQIRRRNRYLLEWIHTPVGELLLYVVPTSIWRMLGELLLLDRVNLKGLGGALLKIPEVLSARAALKNNSKYGFKQVLHLIQAN